MSALPNLSPNLFAETIRMRIIVGHGLCAVAESQADAGMSKRATESLRAVQGILDETSALAGLVRRVTPSEAAEHLELIRGLQHRARNVETVVKLLEGSW